MVGGGGIEVRLDMLILGGSISSGEASSSIDPNSFSSCSKSSSETEDNGCPSAWGSCVRRCLPIISNSLG